MDKTLRRILSLLPLLALLCLLLAGCGTNESSIEKARADAYSEGYKDGYDKGYDEGYDNGWNDGFEDGKKEAKSTAPQVAAAAFARPAAGVDYVVNLNTKKFHYPDCSSVSAMKAKNRMDYTGSRDELIEQGFVPCKNCNP